MNIWKYKLNKFETLTKVNVPRYSEVLGVFCHNDEPFIYFLVDSDEPEQERNIYCFETGENIDKSILRFYKFVGTVETNHSYISHIFA
jgi:hypothetical protein